MSVFLQDLRYSFRQLARSPGFTAIAVLSLAFGIGANLSVFSFINAILLRPLPVPESSRLVSIYHQVSPGGLSSSSYPDYEYYRDHNDVFTGMLAYLRVPMLLRAGGNAEEVSGELVSADYFSVLGLRPALGRTFRVEEGRTAGANPVAVISHNLWQHRFGGSPGVLGESVTLGGQAFTVIGVAPRDFRGLVLDWGNSPEVWIPASMYKEAVPDLAKMDVLHAWGMQSFLVVGRLRPGVSFGQAQAALKVLSAQAAPLREAAFKQENLRFEAVLFSAQQGRIWPEHRASVVQFFGVLAAVAGVVLLIACLNVANLLLARASTRQAEIAVRAALGAGGGRLIRQLLTESLLLSLFAGAGGLAIAYWTTGFLATFQRAFHIPLALDTGPDVRVLGCAFLLALATGLLFGLLPARQASRLDLTSNLKSRTAETGSKGGRLRNALVMAQIAFSLTVLVAAGLLIRTLRNAERADSTADPGHVLLAKLNLATQGYDQDRAMRFYPQLLERVRALPGVRSAALVWILPLSGMRGGTNIVVESARGSDAPKSVQMDYNVISPDYFQTVGVPVLRGREFTIAERAGGERAAVINERMAQRFWRGEDPLGKRFQLAGSKGESVVVVGVVKDTKFRNIRESVRACFYLPFSQRPQREMNLEVRSAGDPTRLVASMREVLKAMDPALVLPEVLTLKSHRDESLAQERLATALLSGLGLLVLCLAVIGIYGVISFAVSRRTREIGIRMALGARPGDVLGMVLRRGFVVVVAGLAVGCGIAGATTRLLASLLYGVSPLDTATFAGVSVLLAAVALAACYIPARRASRVDPVIALRHE